MPRQLLLRSLPLAAAASLLGACGRPDVAPAPRGATAVVTLTNAQGQPAGTATLTSTGNGVFVSAQLRNLPEGLRAMHFHAVGRCERPGFESAGDHFAPGGQQHGFLNPAGQHAGDLPNVTVRSDGTAVAEAFAAEVTLGSGPNSLLGGNGTALVIHSGVDDYRSDPSGNAGPRIACGVVQRR